MGGPDNFTKMAGVLAVGTADWSESVAEVVTTGIMILHDDGRASFSAYVEAEEGLGL